MVDCKTYTVPDRFRDRTIRSIAKLKSSKVEFEFNESGIAVTAPKICTILFQNSNNDFGLI